MVYTQLLGGEAECAVVAVCDEYGRDGGAARDGTVGEVREVQ